MKAFLLDIDGTLLTSDGVIPGAPSILRTLRTRAIPFRLITNTTMRSRSDLLYHLEALGFVVAADEVMTPSLVAAALLDERGCRTVAPFIPEPAINDLGDRDFVGGVTGRSPGSNPEAVVMGDLGEQWDARLLNEAFRYVLNGALLVALQKGRYWLAKSGPLLDAGAYVSAIEYGSNQQAIVCGKPEKPFFEAALKSMYPAGVSREARSDIVMVGDDMRNDVLGAQRVGIQGWLVKTGKYKEKALQLSDVKPDRVIDSVADVLEA